MNRIIMVRVPVYSAFAKILSQWLLIKIDFNKCHKRKWKISNYAINV